MEVKKSQQEAFIEIMVNKNPEIEGVKNDFAEMAKKLLILKEKFEFLTQEDVTPYMAELTEKALDSISRLQSLLEMQRGA